MKVLQVTAIAAALAIGTAGFASAVRADNTADWRENVKFTFDQPVQVPGDILPAGTYWFKLVDPNSSAGAVEILDQDAKIVAMLPTAPATRINAPFNNDVSLTIAEPADGPAALIEYFYPTKNIGHEFVYSKDQKRLLREQRQVTLNVAPHSYGNVTVHVGS